MLARDSLTVPPPQPAGMSPVLSRNIASLAERRRRAAATASLADRLSDRITAFAGSMVFVALHAVVFGTWVLVNVGWIPGVPRWDETFVILGTTASVEAIFLSTFVLISQNRMTVEGRERADLDLQISLLAEHEITRLVAMTAAIAQRLEIATEADGEVAELARDVAPEAVLDELAARDPAGG